ncbi:proton myo-inositol cotransporter-like [Lineus longissimus]|uniref:proton myo-inositol cotransporter-like n=1 Tax=Lineus longissimus TaxID=88925 RepID=UPI00315DE24E
MTYQHNGKMQTPQKSFEFGPQTPVEDNQFRFDNLKPAAPTPRFVYILTIISAIGGFLFGYDTGVISGAMILLRNKFILNSLWQEMIVSMTIGAAAIFALFGGFLNDRIGRKPVVLMASLIYTAGALCLAFTTGKSLLLAGRIIIGAGIGLTSMTTPMYIAEAAPSHIRGRLVSCNVAMIACGQFVANVVDGIFSFNENGWRYMLGLGAIPSVILFLGFLFLPESPRWLIIQDKEAQAREVLQHIRGEQDIEEEFECIKTNCMLAEIERKERSTRAPIILQMLQTPSLRRALLIGCSLQMFQQLAGINTVMYYSATIIKMSGVKDEVTAIWLSAVTSAVNFLFTFVGLYLVEKIGRRPLTLGSLIGAIISLIWLAVGFQLAALNSPSLQLKETVSKNSHCSQYSTCNQCMEDLYCGYCYMDGTVTPYNGSCLPTNYDNPLSATVGRCNATELPGAITWAYEYCPTSYAWMAMVGLVLYLVFFAPGMGPMPWTINSEIYPLWARSTGNAVSTFTNWIFNLIVSMTFLTLTESLTRYGTFWLYAALTTLGFIVLVLLLPETKGKSLEEVEGLFARPWFGTGAVKLQSYAEKSVQYVHIRGLNRDGRDSELDSPE